MVGIMPPRLSPQCQVRSKSHASGIASHAVHYLETEKKTAIRRRFEKMLGDKYSVRNFGVNGHTLQKNSCASYWRHKHFRASSEFAPHIVLIMLGTNDARKENWKGILPFSVDYQAMIEHYQALPCRPIVYAIVPPTEFAPRRRSAGGPVMDSEQNQRNSAIYKKAGSRIRH